MALASDDAALDEAGGGPSPAMGTAAPSSVARSSVARASPSYAEVAACASPAAVGEQGPVPLHRVPFVEGARVGVRPDAPHATVGELAAAVGRMKATELRSALAAIGVPASGLKAALASQLLDAITNGVAPLITPSAARARLRDHLASASGQMHELLAASTPTPLSTRRATRQQTASTPKPQADASPSSSEQSSARFSRRPTRGSRAASGAATTERVVAFEAEAPAQAAPSMSTRGARQRSATTPSVASRRLRSTRL